jgi:preprotein translocase subunit YajC
MTQAVIILQQGGGGAMGQMLMILMVIVVFYFFMIRPQMRKAKLENTFRKGLAKGDKVVTIGGVHGKIVEVAETSLLVEVDQNVKLRIEKSAISAEASKQFQPKAEKK